MHSLCSTYLALQSKHPKRKQLRTTAFLLMNLQFKYSLGKVGSYEHHLKWLQGWRLFMYLSLFFFQIYLKACSNVLSMLRASPLNFLSPWPHHAVSLCGLSFWGLNKASFNPILDFIIAPKTFLNLGARELGRRSSCNFKPSEPWLLYIYSYFFSLSLFYILLQADKRSQEKPSTFCLEISLACHLVH